MDEATFHCEEMMKIIVAGIIKVVENAEATYIARHNVEGGAQ
jgi:hypothetical protein